MLELGRRYFCVLQPSMERECVRQKQNVSLIDNEHRASFEPVGKVVTRECSNDLLQTSVGLESPEDLVTDLQRAPFVSSLNLEAHSSAGLPFVRSSGGFGALMAAL